MGTFVVIVVVVVLVGAAVALWPTGRKPKSGTKGGGGYDTAHGPIDGINDQ